jgi:hypothetical protein
MDAKTHIPFGEALETIRKARLTFGQNRWESWLRCGLVQAAERIPGTNSYGLPLDQWERLKRLVVIDHQLFGRKSPEAVAYFAALWGIDVPVALVAQHLIKSVHTVYGITRRWLIRQSSGFLDPRDLYEEDIRRLSVKAARDVLKIVLVKNPIKRTIAKQFIEEVYFVVLQTVYSARPFPSIGASIRRVANGIFRAPTVALGARFLRNALKSEGPRFVDPAIGDNQILREIDSTQRDQPHLILRACRDSGLALLAVRRGFGNKDEHPPGPPPKLTGAARENARFFYAVIPMFSAFFLAINLDNPKNRFLTILRTSEGKLLEEQVRRFDRIVEWHSRRLERGL